MFVQDRHLYDIFHFVFVVLVTLVLSVLNEQTKNNSAIKYYEATLLLMRNH